MKALASFILRGPSQAMLVAVGTAVLAMMLPPLTLLSGAAVALYTLRIGVRPGAMVMVGSAAFVGALAYVSLGNMLPGLVFLAAIWLPVWVLAWVLRQTRSLTLATLVAGGLGVAAVLLAYLLVGDVTAWWETQLLAIFEPAMQADGPLADEAAVQAILADIAKLMTGIVISGMVLNAVICLYLARAWQAQLFNPGGFRSEFYELRLGRKTALAAIAVLFASMLPLGDVTRLAGELMIVAMSLYMIQGLAMFHAIVAKRNMHVAWLIGLYLVTLFVLPQLLALVAVVGLIDTWADFRRRVS
jgi:hypothetical protein